MLVQVNMHVGGLSGGRCGEETDEVASDVARMNVCNLHEPTGLARAIIEWSEVP